MDPRTTLTLSHTSESHRLSEELAERHRYVTRHRLLRVALLMGLRDLAAADEVAVREALAAAPRAL